MTSRIHSPAGAPTTSTSGEVPIPPPQTWAPILDLRFKKQGAEQALEIDLPSIMEGKLAAPDDFRMVGP